MLMDLGEHIRELRLNTGMTQENLADKTGISTRSIQRIENGLVIPRADSIHKISIALGVPFDVLNPQKPRESEADQIWFAAIHFSGLLLLVIPTLIIWATKKETIPAINKHAADVINFQLNLLVIMVPCGILAILLITIPVLVLTAILGICVIIINSVRVILKINYHYPILFNFFKKPNK